MMNDQDALKYAQSIWGAGQWNAKVKKVGRKHQIGRHNKGGWILGEGATWEEAFREYWIDILDYRKRVYANSPVAARGSLTDSEFHQSNAEIQAALDANTLPVMKAR
jgi:hypothetical protein